MSGKKSKIKGKKYESDVAKFLSDTYSDYFMRVPGSGALIGGQNSNRKIVMSEGQIRSFKGDIIPPDNWTTFHCEAKSYSDLPFHMLFAQYCKIFDTWIDQVREAEDPGDFNLITMKFNRKGQWVAVEHSKGFDEKLGLRYKDWVYYAWDIFWNIDHIDLVKTLSTNPLI